MNRITQAVGTALVRWIFSDVRADGFHWRAVISTDAGASWRLQQAMVAVRRDPAGAAQAGALEAR